MKSKNRTYKIILLTLGALIASGLSGCSNSDETAQDKLQIVSNFYPVKYLVDAIGGDLVTNTSLTPDGAEPHDLTLDPKALASINSADAIFFIGASFQPDVDKAVENLPSEVTAIDLSRSPGVVILDAPSDLGKESLAGGKDPHIWLDPKNMSAMAADIAKTLKLLDPNSVDIFEQNLVSLVDKLDSLNKDFSAGLASCEQKTLVTSHAAFQYLAATYGLNQLAITGISPEDQPDAKLLAELATEAKRVGVKTVFFEDVLPADLSETVARAIGATTSLLSALEFTPEGTNDYISMMRDNLANLRAGLNCR
jgi:zinc transport system substrate-binding protein